MTNSRKKVMHSLSMAFLVILIINIPLSIVNAEITEQSTQSTEEASLDHAPQFFFTETNLTGVVNEQQNVVFYSDQKVTEVQIQLPKESIIIEEEFPEGMTIEETKNKTVWVLKFVEPQQTFMLPLKFESAGQYEVELGVKKFILEIQEQNESTNSTLKKEMEYDQTFEAIDEEADNLENESNESEQSNEESFQLAPEDSELVYQKELGDTFDKQAYNEHISLFNNVFDNISLPNSSNKVEVDINHLEEYFKFNNDATNDGNGQVTLTKKIGFQTGAITLKEKMLMDYPMKLSGSVNIGDTANKAPILGIGGSKEGGDGIGIGFHSDEVDAIGETGQGMGLAGLKSSFGFKIDTFRNNNNSLPPYTTQDPATIDGETEQAFGGFIYTDNAGYLQNYMGNEAPPRVTTNPANNQFRDISVVYNPGKEFKVLSVSYEGRTWRVDISQWLSNEKELSFIISAATGGAVNLHQIRLTSFEYVTEEKNYEYIVGDKSNFEDHFTINGDAKYDTTSGIITFTEKKKDQNGNVQLKEKLSNKYPFEITGRVNIGDGVGGNGGRSSNGGDGIGFGFHQSDPTDIGEGGQGMGLAGLKNAWGFKLDTYYNENPQGHAAADLSNFKSSWSLLSGTTHKPHGAYIYTRNDGILVSHPGNNNDACTPREILKNNNNQFRDFRLSYNPGEYDSILSIEYNGQVWHHDVSQFTSSENVTALSFVISAATGSQSNLQQMEISSFKYVTGAGVVNVEYKDIETGEDIIPSESQSGLINQKIIVDSKQNDKEIYQLGYDFVGISDDSFDLVDTDGNYTFSDEEKTIVYYFKRAIKQVKVKHRLTTGGISLKEEVIDLPVNREKEFLAEDFEECTLLYIKKDEEIFRNVESITVTIQRDSPQKIEFYYREDIANISPLDPLKPEIEVDPENKPTLPDNQGRLSIDFISQFQFGALPISVKEEVYFAQPQRLLYADGTVSEIEKRPNYVQITDRRAESERNGWVLSLTQLNQFASNPDDSETELKGALLSLTNQQLATTSQDGVQPVLVEKNTVDLYPTMRKTLLTAQGTEGIGTWIYRFGDAQTAGESVLLSVPKGANPEATTYTATLSWELSAVPRND
ncbi:hypothetical protein HED42_16840 [Enterococcus casseliflavus]|uniref:lectin-like domain-containing protein n=1 Tax=Enterococcus casseliflavus TaxID=37734 RepID=UPI0014332592|nr:WxL domain-containing protein [Enterococcus casseliflavus]NKD39801.1 hypothetical protein [Enterococcus casseliflavus]